MRGKPILWVVLLVVALMTVACGGAAEPTDAQPSPQLEVDESEPELAEQPAGQESPSEVAQPAPTEGGVLEEAIEPEQETVEGAAPAESSLEPRPHRAAPAPPGDFVADQAQFVGATGNPQLVEFFTYW
jgi:hypothetical protein